ncbi:MAG: hypothetical protein QF471_07060 [Phycisphaerales bacterium]|nr:hypothetical protein [Phycisphaerales bacterium]
MVKSQKKPKPIEHPISLEELRMTLSKIRQALRDEFATRQLPREIENLELLTEKDVSRLAKDKRNHWKWPCLASIPPIGLCTFLLLFFYLRPGFASSGKEPSVTLHDSIEMLDGLFNYLVSSALGVYVCWQLAAWLRRRKPLKVLHNIRSLAQIMDQLQSNKTVIDRGEVSLSLAQRVHYLEATERSITIAGKIASTLLINHNDRIIIDEVTEIEQACNSMAIRIWQKIAVLNQQRLAEGSWQQGTSP